MADNAWLYIVNISHRVVHELRHCLVVHSGAAVANLNPDRYAAAVAFVAVHILYYNINNIINLLAKYLAEAHPLLTRQQDLCTQYLNE